MLITLNHIRLLSRGLPLPSRCAGCVRAAVPSSHTVFLSLVSSLGRAPMRSPPGVAAEVVHRLVPFVTQPFFIFSNVLKIIIFSGQETEPVS